MTDDQARLIAERDDQHVIDMAHRDEAGRLSEQFEVWARSSSAQGVAVIIRPETAIRAAALLRILAGKA